MMLITTTNAESAAMVLYFSYDVVCKNMVRIAVTIP